jgi:hypothetical protein
MHNTSKVTRREYRKISLVFFSNFEYTSAVIAIAITTTKGGATTTKSVSDPGLNVTTATIHPLTKLTIISSTVEIVLTSELVNSDKYLESPLHIHTRLILS